MNVQHDATDPRRGRSADGEFSRDTVLVPALRRRDERAFEWVLDRYRPALLRLARQYVPTSAIAEEVVQDAFLAVFTGIDRFEGRSSFKTWIYRIVMNLARTRGVREQRSVPFTSISGDDDRAIERDWFVDTAQDRSGHWRSSPTRWDGFPEDRAVAGELRDVLDRAIETLPERQREVLVLRDVLGSSSHEVCNALDLTETNQRVLLHRARTRLRKALDEFYTEST